MLETKLVRERCSFYKEEAGVPQTLAWQPEESCGASAAAGCLSLPHTHLGKHINGIANTLQISSRAVGLYCQRAPIVPGAMKIAGVAKLCSC